MSPKANGVEAATPKGDLRPPASACIYPGSNPLGQPIWDALAGVRTNSEKCSSFYLDTVEGMSNDTLSTEGEDHHQGLARTQQLSDGSIYFFLSHSELDTGDKGSLSQFHYTGPTDGEHILETSPLTVAPMKQLLPLDEQHPSDIAFLPAVNHKDGGYLFVTEEFDNHRLAIYEWEPDQDLRPLGCIQQGFPQGAPNFVFVDKVDDTYYLGIASNNTGWGKLFQAKCNDLFPYCDKAGMDISAFVPVAPESMFPFPVIGGASQVKLIKDSTGEWFLLGFRSDPSDDPKGTDYVDVYNVKFSPFFYISYRLFSTQILLKPGDTGFASTGTHYVEPSGRLLISSSYRWAEDEDPNDSSFVSRVDECPSS